MPEVPPPVVNAVTINDHVLTAMVGFVFVCIVYPKLVRHKAQFYTAFMVIILTMVLGTMSWMFYSDSFGRFATVIRGFTEIIALVLLVLSTGGLSLKELAGEMSGAIEVIRRGETTKEYIIPLTGEQPKPKSTASRKPDPVPAEATESDEFGPIDRSPPPRAARPGRPPGKDGGPIPLE